MDFDDYLLKKKIDPNQFRSKEQSKYQSLKDYYNASGPLSFEHAKKFLINPTRRRYPLSNEREG
jgi:hypothetical protein